MGEKKADSGCSCGCGPKPKVAAEQCCQSAGQEPWLSGSIRSAAGVAVPRVNTALSLQDRFGAWKARWNIGRMDYKVAPGLYGVGNPTPESPVLVTANYKMTFDRLRCQLSGRDLWILVLDTKGINVWCAAGKGTFGTAELVQRIAQVGLGEIVTHRNLILPQLGAPGVAAPEVRKLTGFKVSYGTVRASDLPEFLDGGLKATAPMREVRFGWRDRLAVAPVELVSVLKPAVIWFSILFFLNWLAVGAITLGGLLQYTAFGFVPYLGAILAGTVLVPLLLPLVPGRAFAWKGWLVGFLWTLGYIGLIAPQSWGGTVVFLLLLPTIASFLAMNFTGASTYTSLSGVVKEMKVAVPYQVVTAGLGFLLLVARTFVSF
ncbi:MAG TPA: mercury methylation corrinoid protein HgcA [Bacillota bacterium]|nr:mercury methylation corrinoid protein HgcA [Bacillota bacterium]